MGATKSNEAREHHILCSNTVLLGHSAHSLIAVVQGITVWYTETLQCAPLDITVIFSILYPADDKLVL